MSDAPPDLTEADLPAETADESEGMKALRAALKRANEKAAAGTTAQRTLAFRDAGIDTSKGVGAKFAQHYDGELTPEAIKAEASNWGLTAAPADPDPADPAAVAAAAAAALEEDKGRRLPGDDSVTPAELDLEATSFDAMFAEYEDAVAKGANRERARGGLLNRMAAAAANGDKRFIFDPEAHRQEALEYEGQG